eukprot:3464650-Rhodomonas_salina.1
MVMMMMVMMMMMMMMMTMLGADVLCALSSFRCFHHCVEQRRDRVQRRHTLTPHTLSHTLSLCHSALRTRAVRQRTLFHTLSRLTTHFVPVLLV